MRLVAIVITYFPNIQEVINNIYQYIEDVDHLIIWENTPILERDRYKIVIPKYSHKISYMSIDKNMGISYPINKAIQWGTKNKCTHIMTMDQDSKWENFSVYKSVVEKYNDKNIAIFAPMIKDEYFGKCFSQYMQPITSGAIYPIHIFQHIGLFKENYFIDCVDSEFYYRAILMKYTVVPIDEGILSQQFGNYFQSKLFKFHTRGYSSFRLYHIVRNNIWLWREYKDKNVLPNGFLFKVVIEEIFKPTIKILLAEQNKSNKIKAIYRGLYNGLKNKIYE